MMEIDAKEQEIVRLKQKLEATKLSFAAATDMLRDATNMMPQGLVIFGEKNIEFANPRTWQLLDAPEELLQVGKPWYDYLKWLSDNGHYGEGAEAKATLDAVVHNIKNRIPSQAERMVPNGRVVRIDSVKYSGGGMLYTFTDVTESRQREADLEGARAEAESAERAKSEFLANMSHEIRTPMNGVLGMAELLTGTDLDTKQKTFADIILKSGTALLTIINDILDFSKLDAGQMALVSETFKLSEAIEDVATLVSTRVAEKDLELIVRVQPDLPPMLIGDMGRIRQIVTNLMGNAVKFTDAGHVLVDVSGTVENQIAKLKFSVTDTGIGIPEDKVASMFDKFSQVDTTSTRRHEGTGLGLAITKQLVELMDGDIGACSVFGEGSTFWFSIDLPVDVDHVAVNIIPSDVTGAQILVVDDNVVNRTILAEQLASWNMQCAEVASGPHAIQTLRASVEHGIKVDGIILDYHMPEMNGAEVARILRDDPQLNSIPVVMLTSMDIGMGEGSFSDLKVDAHLMKPARSSLLLETLVNVIQLSRSSENAAPPISTATAEQVPELQQDVAKPAMDVQPPSIETPIAPKDDVVPETLAKVQGKRWNAESLQAATPGLAQLDVLVAEDNEVNQMVVSQVLESIGVNFEIVENGALAVDAYKSNPPRLILMDVSMPVLNGHEATKAIREHEVATGIRTPIIGCTAHALTGDRENCIASGMDDYLSKPISPKLLEDKISEWIDPRAKMAI